MVPKYMLNSHLANRISSGNNITVFFSFNSRSLIFISLVFFYLSKPQHFLGFFQFQAYFVGGQNISKYVD